MIEILGVVGLFFSCFAVEVVIYFIGNYTSDGAEIYLVMFNTIAMTFILSYLIFFT